MTMPRSVLRRVIVVAATCAATAGSIAPAHGGVAAEPPVPAPSAPTGDVSATFTPRSPSGPCLTLGGPTTVDFGMLALGGGFGAGSAPTTVTSCGAPGQVQDVMASVSSATTAGLPRWTPFDCGANGAAACVTPTNQFAYLLAGVSLTSTPRMIGPVDVSLDHRLRLPAPGSSGGGEVIQMTVTILAVLR